MQESQKDSTPADEAVALVMRKAKARWGGSSVLWSMRIPAPIASQILALADKSQRTKSATIMTMLEVGIDEVMKRLPEKDRDEVSKLASKHFGELE